MPVHCSASGKLLLAFSSKELQEHVLSSAPFTSYTKKTITTARVFARELEKIRKRGYSEDDQELIPGVNCFAVPIKNRHGEAVAALAVMAPAASLPLERLRAHVAEIRECAECLGKELGWDKVAAVKPSLPPTPRPPRTRRGSQSSPGKHAL